ncbi:MAG: hypothetical protein IJU15_03945 [Synergistaceae bacterium]|nr:hypothetical protein [Synergistaceae bacterium]
MDIKVDNLDRFIDKINGSFGIVLICLIAGFVLLSRYEKIKMFNKFLSLICQFFMGIFLVAGASGLVMIGFWHFKAQFVSPPENVTEAENNLQVESVAPVIIDDSLQKEFAALSMDYVKLSAEKSELEEKINTLTLEISSLRLKNSELAEQLTSMTANDNTSAKNIDVNNLKKLLTAKVDLNKFIEAFTQSGIFSGHHYTVLHDYTEWRLAIQKCKELGGHIVTINSEEENNFICSLIELRHPASDCWIGAIKTKDKEYWEWQNGEPFVFSKLKPGHLGKEHDYFMYIRNKEWYSWSADSYGKGYYICEWDF